MSSQVGVYVSPKRSPDFSRRDLLRFCTSAATLTFLPATGCVTRGNAELPQLLWGRRGLSDGRFLKPRAITIDHQDRLYIVDTTGRIQVFDADGNFSHQWKTPETANGRPTGLAFQRSSQRSGPAAPTKDAGGSKGESDRARILVADTHYYRMLSYNLQGELLESEQIGGTSGHLPGEFAFVTDVACDEQGAFYIGEYNASDRIQKFDPEGNFVLQWGGNGQEPGQFVRPQSLLIRDGVLWVADACNHRIQRFDIREDRPRLMDIWGRPGSAPGEFYYPYDLAIASDQSVVVIEYKNNRVQRFDRDGRFIASWGSPGFEPGRLNQPWGLVIDSQDRVHLLDSNNHRVQRIGLPS